MNRLQKMFRRLKKDGRCGLIAYVTCGDPDPATTAAIVLALEAAGADAIELGVPFSDPIADGPVIQEASQRALAAGTTIRDVFAIAKQVREHSAIPLVAFSYLNPILRMGEEPFADAAAAAGIDALLLTDLPPEAAGGLRTAMSSRGLSTVFLLAPTSTARRIKAVDRASDAFVYYVSTTGVTGTGRDLDPALVERLGEVRRSLKHPIAVGFGISEHEHYVALREHCDAVVVGSAIVRAIASGDAEGAPERAAAVVQRILAP
jgi:tryptophan synthase alpha chain